MKIKFHYFFFCLCFPILTQAQSYSITPATTVTVTAPFTTLSIFDIYQNNLLPGDLFLSWEVVSYDLPPGWDFSICDYGSCYVGLPPQVHFMDTVNQGGQAFLKLNIDPSTIAGSGIVKVQVWETGTSGRDTLTWIVNAGPSSINEAVATNTFSVYPVPASDFIFLKNTKDILTLNVVDVSGNIARTVASPSFNTGIDITELAPGIYFLNAAYQNSKTVTTKFIKAN